jgi:sRNA-binding regulator protein Hfq
MEQIRAEGYGRLYVQKQIKKRTPMVLELYGETVEGVIRRRLTYALDVLVGGKQRRIEKIDIKYMYKRNQTPPTAQWIAIDPELKAKNLVSIVRRSERFHIDNKPLARCCRDKTPVRLILRSGEMITGVIDWFSQYEIKIDVMNGKGIVVFRHGLHRCETDPAGNAE